MSLEYKKIKDEEKIAALIAAIWSFYIILLSVNEIFNNFISYGTLVDSALCYGIFMLFIIRSIVPILKKMRLSDFLFLSIIIMVILLTLLFKPLLSEEIMKHMGDFFMKILPCYFIGGALSDYNILEKALHKASKPTLIFAVIYIILVTYTGNNWLHNMTAAYSILPTSMYLFYLAYKTGKVKDWFWSILAIFVLIMAGTRGPILCLFLFMIICIFTSLRNTRNSLRVLFLLLTFLISYFTGGIYYLINYISQLLLNRGINNVALSRFNNGVFFIDDGRRLLNQLAIGFINEKPVFGHGIYSDRVLLNGYVHQFFLEMFIHYGYIIGGLIILFIFYGCVHLLNTSKKGSFEYYFIWMVIILGVVKLMMSNSYIEEVYFFLLLGMIVKKINQKGRLLLQTQYRLKNQEKIFRQ